MKRIWPLVALLFAFSLCVTPPAVAGGNQGILEVRIKDHREAIGDFAKLILNVDEVLISPKPGLMFWQSGWKRLAVSRQSIDLTKYVGKDSAPVFRDILRQIDGLARKDRKSTRLNSSHITISYAVFCLKKKKKDSSHRR